MAELNEVDLLGIIESVYEAPAERGRWAPVLDRLCSLYDGKAILFQQDTVRGDSGVLEFRGFEPGYVRSYAEHYAALNPCLGRRACLPAGSVATDDMLIEERGAAERSEFYNDWLRPQGLGAAVGAVLEKGERIAVNVAVLRAARRGPITREEQGFFERIAPHLRRALRLDRELAAARIGRDVALDAVDRLGSAGLIVDEQARLLHANRRAENLLRAPAGVGGLGLRQGRLCGPTPADTRALLAALRTAILHVGGLSVAPPPAALRFARADAEPLSVLVLPLHAGGAFGLDLPVALLLAHAPEDMPSFDAARLARFYGLTPACGRLLAGLLSGQGLAEYAKANCISPNTAKTQLQKVFLGTGQARQSDLIRLVLSDPVAVAAARA